jgi:hypothetical protein
MATSERIVLSVESSGDVSVSRQTLSAPDLQITPETTWVASDAEVKESTSEFCEDCGCNHGPHGTPERVAEIEDDDQPSTSSSSQSAPEVIMTGEDVAKLYPGATIVRLPEKFAEGMTEGGGLPMTRELLMFLLGRGRQQSTPTKISRPENDAVWEGDWLNRGISACQVPSDPDDFATEMVRRTKAFISAYEGLLMFATGAMPHIRAAISSPSMNGRYIHLDEVADLITEMANVQNSVTKIAAANVGLQILRKEYGSITAANCASADDISRVMRNASDRLFRESAGSRSQPVPRVHPASSFPTPQHPLHPSYSGQSRSRRPASNPFHSHVDAQQALFRTLFG